MTNFGIDATWSSPKSTLPVLLPKPGASLRNKSAQRRIGWHLLALIKKTRTRALSMGVDKGINSLRSAPRISTSTLP
jgi:hypothetical protein